MGEEMNIHLFVIKENEKVCPRLHNLFFFDETERFEIKRRLERRPASDWGTWSYLHSFKIYFGISP